MLCKFSSTCCCIKVLTEPFYSFFPPFKNIKCKTKMIVTFERALSALTASLLSSKRVDDEALSTSLSTYNITIYKLRTQAAQKYVLIVTDLK